MGTRFAKTQRFQVTGINARSSAYSEKWKSEVEDRNENSLHNDSMLRLVWRMHRGNFFSIVLLFLIRQTAFSASPVQERADHFLRLANAGFQAIFRVNAEAQWTAVTDVTPAHDAAAEATGKAFAAFNGNTAIITETRDLLTHEKELTPITVRQLKQLLLYAAEGPMTNPDLVTKRVEAETKQASILNSFEFKLNGQKITANDIDNKLEKSNDLAERKAVWEASKESGPALKPNLVVLRDLRNGVAKEMKYPDYFSLEVASYGMTTDENVENAGRLDGNAASALRAALHLGEVQTG
jgi:peptidyl-dipeptidase A